MLPSLLPLLTTLLTLLTTVTSRTAILIPLYSYPELGAWDPLFRAIETHPSLPFTIIINPNSGPGDTTYPDTNYISGILKLKTYQNVKLIGYVATTYTARPILDTRSDIAKYVNWSTYDDRSISLSGIFLDEAPEERGRRDKKLRYMRNLFLYIREQFKTINEEGYVITNPGVICDKKFYSYADNIVSFEQEFEHYYDKDTLQTSGDKTKSPGTGAEKQSVIVLKYRGSNKRERYLLRKNVRKGIGHVYFTRSGEYDEFASDFGVLVGQVDLENSLLPEE